MKIFLWFLLKLLLFTNFIQVSQQRPAAKKQFKRIFYGICQKLDEFKPQLVSEEEAFAKSIEIFQPVFAHLVTLYPNPTEEADLVLNLFFRKFKILPPEELIDPVLKDALNHEELVFHSHLLESLEKMNEKILEINSDEKIRLMREIIDEFDRDLNARQFEVEALFPDHNNVDQALLSSIKSVLLLRSYVEKSINYARPLLLAMFKLTNHPSIIFEGMLRLYNRLYGYNYMIRMMEEARKNKADSAEILLRLHTFASSSTITEIFSFQMPFDIYRKFSQVQFKSEREKSFVKCKLASYNYQRESEFCPRNYAYATNSFPLHELVMHQVMLNLEKFVDRDEIAKYAGNELTLFPDWKNFLTKNFETSIMDSTSAEKVATIFINRVDNVIPGAIKSNQRFRLLANLDQDDIDRVLALTIEQIQQTRNEESVFDFKVENEEKKKKKRKNKKRTKRAIQNQNPESFGVNSVDIPNEELVFNKQETSMDSRIEEKLPGKKVHEATIDISVPMASVHEQADSKGKEEDKQVEEDRLIQEEIDELMRIQNEQIQMFRKLKKQHLDLAKARRSNVNVVLEKLYAPKKSRMVAFLHTDDLRLLSEGANELYLRNTAEDAARANISKGNGEFRWFFNPEIVIDFDDYEFLCQVFSVVDGKARLTYDSFLKVFSKLNPAKADDLQKRSKALNRTVFQFDHAFEFEDKVYVPPIGGAHREHLSSRFNHKQIRKFLMHGGCHPYFFEKI